jgi:glycosyltransferase involved in cell wall biosynthesis
VTVSVKPQVSVILPYYEGKRWLTRSVGSVYAQKGVLWELIIVDDGSKDPAEEILGTITEPRIKLLEETHGGKGKALNKGIAAASADVVCFIDQDDIMLPGRLLRQFEVFRSNPDVDVAYSDYERIYDDSRHIDCFISRQASNQNCLHEMAIGRGLVSMQTLMIRRHTVQLIGGFSEDISLTGLDDAEFMSRLFASGAHMKYEPGIVQKWVLHDRNYSQSPIFEESRLVLLEHLNILATKWPMIKKEMPYFKFHNHYMRGLYFIQKKLFTNALFEFRKTVQSRPLHWAGYYMLVKSFMRCLIPTFQRAQI